jgi:hypothetical protein
MSTQTIDSMAIQTVQKIKMVSRIIKTKKELQNYIHHLKKIFLYSLNLLELDQVVSKTSRELNPPYRF